MSWTSIENIREAVARGMRSGKNARKKIDADLVEAIAQEVANLVPENGQRGGSYSRAGYMPSATHRDFTSSDDGFR